jgi:6-pyruvoyl-tetrahydropterin synthase
MKITENGCSKTIQTDLWFQVKPTNKAVWFGSFTVQVELATHDPDTVLDGALISGMSVADWLREMFHGAVFIDVNDRDLADFQSFEQRGIFKVVEVENPSLEYAGRVIYNILKTQLPDNVELVSIAFLE